MIDRQGAEIARLADENRRLVNKLRLARPAAATSAGRPAGGDDDAETELNDLAGQLARKEQEIDELGRHWGAVIDELATERDDDAAAAAAAAEKMEQQLELSQIEVFELKAALEAALNSARDSEEELTQVKQQLKQAKSSNIVLERRDRQLAASIGRLERERALLQQQQQQRQQQEHDSSSRGGGGSGGERGGGGGGGSGGGGALSSMEYAELRAYLDYIKLDPTAVVGGQGAKIFKVLVDNEIDLDALALCVDEDLAVCARAHVRCIRFCRRFTCLCLCTPHCTVADMVLFSHGRKCTSRRARA
jgi:chromosome segregation ATPase